MSTYLYFRDQLLRLPVWLGPLVFGLGLLLPNWEALVQYVHTDLNLWLGLLILPWALIPRTKGEYSWRFAVGAALCMGLYARFHMNIFLLMGLGMGIFLGIERFWGKLSLYPLILLGLISPVMKYLVQSFSFPLRLEMSRFIGAAMNQFGLSIAVEGNVFVWDDMSFAVDPACMGLHALATGMIFTTLMLVFGEQKNQQKLPLAWVSVLYILTLALTLLTNGLRIAALILFKSMPESGSHDLIGMFGLLLYVVVPMHFVIQWVYRNHAISITPTASSFNISGRKWLIPVVMAVGINLVPHIFPKPTQSHSISAFDSLHIPHTQKEVLDQGVAKFENDSLLIYLKAPVPFWASDHSPAVCWQASGYEFRRINKAQLGGNTFFVAELGTESAPLYTAWWYESDASRTHRQVEWRHKTLKNGESFFLVNLTASSAEQLNEAISDWMRHSWIQE